MAHLLHNNYLSDKNGEQGLHFIARSARKVTPIVDSMMKLHQTVLLVIATTVVAGCCRTKTIEVEPIHIEVDARARGTATGEAGPGLVEQVATGVAERVLVPGTLTGDLMLGCTGFYQKHGRWPRELNELAQQFSDADQSAESFRQITMIEFMTLPGGDLEVRYEADGPIKACMKMTKPKDGGSQQDGGANSGSAGAKPE